MCHVSFNLVGIHGPVADRLPSLLAEGGGASRHHAAHLGIASESSSSSYPASVCVRALVDALHAHLCNIQDWSSAGLCGPYGGSGKGCSVSHSLGFCSVVILRVTSCLIGQFPSLR